MSPRHFAFVVALFLALMLATEPARACACCSLTAQRTVEVKKIDAATQTELDKLRFKRAAKLKLDESYEEAIKGLNDPTDNFTLEVTRHGDRITFSLRDEKGRAGTLSLIQPRTISIFEVDPRDDKTKTGYGPRLYKEWKLTTAVAGDGIFKNNVGASRRITLVLHGRGASCTEASEFKHWTLLVHGPGRESYSFYGEMEEIR